MAELSQAFALCAATDDATAIRDDVAFCQAVKSALAKSSGGSSKSPDQLDAAVRQLVSKAIIAEGQVIDVFTAAGLPKPDIGILSDQFLTEVRGLKYKNVAAELLKRLLMDELRTREKAQPRAVGVLQREAEEDAQRLSQPRHRDAGSDRRVDQAREGDRRGREAW